MTRSLLCLMAMGLLAGSVAMAAGTKTFTHKYFLYTVDYPDTWRAKEVSKVAFFTAPKDSPEDTFAENVNVVVEDLGDAAGAVSLMDYHRKSRESASRMLSDFKLLEEAQTQWNGRTAILEIYTASVRGEKFKFKACTFKAGNAFYVLTYTAQPSDYEAVVDAADRLMRSIRVSP